MTSPLIVIPIYQTDLPPLERYSLAYSLGQLSARVARGEVYWLAPQSLDLGVLAKDFPGVGCWRLPDHHFQSVNAYSRLLLSTDFYDDILAGRGIPPSSWVLILQTDAIIFQDQLDDWLGQPYDYLGAPWPNGVELFINLDQFEGQYGTRVFSKVGNGGLSLRRAKACRDLLVEFPNAVKVFLAGGSSEDLFFGLMGSLSAEFRLPNEIVASRFAVEVKPSHYYHVNGQGLPMGSHAWWKYEPAFWREQLGNLESQPPWEHVDLSVNVQHVPLNVQPARP